MSGNEVGMRENIKEAVVLRVVGGGGNYRVRIDNYTRIMPLGSIPGYLAKHGKRKGETYFVSIYAGDGPLHAEVTDVFRNAGIKVKLFG
jgi:hypothetical protein